LRLRETVCVSFGNRKNAVQTGFEPVRHSGRPCGRAAPVRDCDRARSVGMPEREALIALVASLRACGAHVLLCQPLAVSCSLLIHNLAGDFIWRHSANRLRLNQLQILCHRPGMCGSTRHYPKRRLKNGSVHENLYHDLEPFHRYLTKNRRSFQMVITDTGVRSALCLLLAAHRLTRLSNQRNPRGHLKNSCY
jgi:hypothetical protein